jgi:hypothetical protein
MEMEAPDVGVDDGSIRGSATLRRSCFGQHKKTSLQRNAQRRRLDVTEAYAVERAFIFPDSPDCEQHTIDATLTGSA